MRMASSHVFKELGVQSGCQARGAFLLTGVAGPRTLWEGAWIFYHKPNLPCLI